jgi:hypothetical protein
VYTTLLEFTAKEASLDYLHLSLMIISVRSWQTANGREMTTPFQRPESQQKSFHDVRFPASRFRHTQASKVRTWKSARA